MARSNAAQLSLPVRSSSLKVLDGGLTRPVTRADCAHVPRPCPFVTCKYNLSIDVTPAGAISVGTMRIESLPEKATAERTERFVDLVSSHLLDVGHSCALDEADGEGLTLHEVGNMVGVTRERIRQIEAKAMRRMRQSGVAIRRLREWTT